MSDNNVNITLPSKEQVEAELKTINYRKRFIKTLLSTLSILVVVAALAVLISTLFFPVIQVSGNSMEPSLHDGDVLVLIKSDNVSYGDMCCFSWQNKTLLKRVIGMAGDTINIDAEGNVFVNNELLEEDYISEKTQGINDIEYPYLVPENKIFVLGDHRGTSLDSRSSAIGCIDKEQIVGKVIFKVWSS